MAVNFTAIINKNNLHFYIIGYGKFEMLNNDLLNRNFTKYLKILDSGFSLYQHFFRDDENHIIVSAKNRFW